LPVAGACIYDDINGRPIPGMDEFPDLVNVAVPYPCRLRRAVRTDRDDGRDRDFLLCRRTDAVARKFGAGGPFNPGTGRPYKETVAVRGAPAPMDVISSIAW
jgi:hypothetical protein